MPDRILTGEQYMHTEVLLWICVAGASVHHQSQRYFAGVPDSSSNSDLFHLSCLLGLWDIHVPETR